MAGTWPSRWRSKRNCFMIKSQKLPVSGNLKSSSWVPRMMSCSIKAKISIRLSREGLVHPNSRAVIYQNVIPLNKAHNSTTGMCSTVSLHQSLIQCQCATTLTTITWEWLPTISKMKISSFKAQNTSSSPPYRVSFKSAILWHKAWSKLEILACGAHSWTMTERNRALTQCQGRHLFLTRSTISITRSDLQDSLPSIIPTLASYLQLLPIRCYNLLSMRDRITEDSSSTIIIICKFMKCSHRIITSQ